MQVDAIAQSDCQVLHRVNVTPCRKVKRIKAIPELQGIQGSAVKISQSVHDSSMIQKREQGRGKDMRQKRVVNDDWDELRNE